VAKIMQIPATEGNLPVKTAGSVEKGLLKENGDGGTKDWQLIELRL
jgi:hypothetical protein